MGKLRILWLASLLFSVHVTSATEDCRHACVAEETCKTKLFANICYYLFNVTRTWKESRELCISQGLTMAKLDGNVLKQNFTTSDWIKNEAPFSWLGGRRKWTFFNGISLNETGSDWISKLEDEGDHQCGVLSISNSSNGNFPPNIEAEDCNQSHKFICRYDDCPDNPSVLISGKPETWQDARARCKSLDSDLLYLKRNDQAENLTKKITLFYGEKFFIGLTCTRWMWDEGSEISHFNWMKESISASDNCLMMYLATAKWKATDCNTVLHVLCQSVAEAPANESAVENSTETKPVDHSSEPGNVENTKVAVMTAVILMALLVPVNAIVVGVCFCRQRHCHIECPCKTSTEVPAAIIPEEQIYNYIELRDRQNIRRTLPATPAHSDDEPSGGRTTHAPAVVEPPSQTDQEENGKTLQSATSKHLDDGAHRVSSQTHSKESDPRRTSEGEMPQSAYDDGYLVPSPPQIMEQRPKPHQVDQEGSNGTAGGETCQGLDENGYLVFIGTQVMEQAPEVAQGPTPHQVDQEGSGRTAGRETPQGVDENGYLVLISGRENTVEQNLAHFNNLADPSSITSRIMEENSDGDIVQNEYTTLGTGQSPEEQNGSSTNVAENPYTPLCSKCK